LASSCIQKQGRECSVAPAAGRCQAPPQTSRAFLNTLVAALCVDRRRHAHMQVFGERVELGLLARAARGLAEATLARTGKPPHLELPEAPSPAKRVARNRLHCPVPGLKLPVVMYALWNESMPGSDLTSRVLVVEEAK